MSGLGGIGKTQTAVEYAYRYRDDYQAICWIRSDTPEELAKDFASLAQLLQLPEREVPEQAYIIAAVKRWFETHAGWLLIFDNADELAIIDDYLPQGNEGHILITTRSQVVSGIAEKIELAKMNYEDGTHFLLRRANRTGNVTEEDQRAIQEIIKEFDGLPLALDQAGAYLEETGETFTNYLWLYQDQRTELLQRRGGYRSDHAPVATTWSLAFQRIEQINASAIELIRLCAFLAPDAIPEELITSTAHHLGPTFSTLNNRSRFNEAIAALLKYSLIQRDATTTSLSIHRLVQAVIKDEMRKTQRNQWAERIVRIVSIVFPFDEVAPWTQSQRYLPHALLAVEYINHLHFTSLRQEMSSTY